MKGVTHLASGIILGISLGFYKPEDLGVLCVATLLPDIDRAQSLMGRYIPAAPAIIKWVFGKRTLTHSLLFGGLIAWYLYLEHHSWLMPFAIGYLLHLFLDLLTGYVALLFPLPSKLTLTVGVSPKIIEILYLVGLVVVVAAQYQFFLDTLVMAVHS